MSSARYRPICPLNPLACRSILDAREIPENGSHRLPFLFWWHRLQPVRFSLIRQISACTPAGKCSAGWSPVVFLSAPGSSRSSRRSPSTANNGLRQCIMFTRKSFKINAYRASVRADSKGFTEKLNPLHATLTRKVGGGPRTEGGTNHAHPYQSRPGGIHVTLPRLAPNGPLRFLVY